VLKSGLIEIGENSGGFENLGQAKALRLIDLQNNNLDLSMKELYQQILIPLADLPKLQYLYLANNPVESIIPNYRLFVIHELPKLEYLDDIRITKEANKFLL
jgi:Leucine-rich repeat (LRR) protein